MKKKQIIIGADLVPTKDNYDLFESGDIEKLVGIELKKIIEDADMRIYNLECVISDNGEKIKKCGPHLSAPTSVMKGIAALKPNIVTLANNHIMDLGEDGLKSTISQLEKNNIKYIGAGKDLNEARKPYYFELDGYKIGIYATSEHEFSSASEKQYGSNSIDLLEDFDAIRKIKKECDYLILLYHGGNERYRYPAPYLQKICRKFVECGVNLLICQHSHCVGCKEDYAGGTIIYGQGNFHFVRQSDDFFKTSLLVQLKINKEKNKSLIDIDYIPITLSENSIKLADEKEKNKILEDFYKRSNEILNKKIIEDKYDEFSKKMCNEIYYPRILGRISNNIFYKILNKLFQKKITKKLFSKKDYLAILNALKCEAHRETFINGLEKIKK